MEASASPDPYELILEEPKFPEEILGKKKPMPTAKANP